MATSTLSASIRSRSSAFSSLRMVGSSQIVNSQLDTSLVKPPSPGLSLWLRSGRWSSRPRANPKSPSGAGSTPSAHTGTGPSASPAKHPRVPVQPLQIQQPLVQRPMPRLMHPQHAVHALHRAAGSHRSAQHRRHRPIRLTPVRVDLLAEELLHQQGRLAIASRRGRVRGPRPLPTQPPQVHQERLADPPLPPAG